VLETAIDRFVVGRKRSLQHPNRINEPNWDKIVDYVIAMETLFLTSRGGNIDGELSYRLSVNGTLVLRQRLPFTRAFCSAHLSNFTICVPLSSTVATTRPS
jgi:hypothetical protein